MVKILQAYNFAKQNTYTLNGDILAATLIDDNRIAITSAEQLIEIYDIDTEQQQQQNNINRNISINDHNDHNFSASGGNIGNEEGQRMPKKYSLATVGEVVNLIYCKAGKYLLTLEKENAGSPIHSNSTNLSCTSSSNTTTIDPEEEKKMFVRIYANFLKFPDDKLADLPITIRIASMTTPKAPLLESIDVIELPLRSFPHLIQCCQVSGNIIVSCKDRIYLYEYMECVHENAQPRFSFIDFFPFKFFVSLNFIPLKLCLAENVIACMNTRYCVAFKIVDVITGNMNQNGHVFDISYNDNTVEEDVDESQGDASIISKASASYSAHSHNSYETDSLSTSPNGRAGTGGSGFPGKTPIDYNVAKMVNSAYGREFEVDIRSQFDINESLNGTMSSGYNSSTTDAQEIFITPTRANEIKIKLVNEAKAMNVQRICSNDYLGSALHDDSLVQYDIRKLLQIHMQSSEPSGRIVDILRCMDLKAIYQRSSQKTKEANEFYLMGNQQVPGAVTTFKHASCRTLKSSMHNNCIGYALLVTSSVDGYLYQFCSQGKWYNENEKPIAIYSFTAPLLHVHINDYVIYAVTTESVETHSSRIGHKIFNNRFEYPMVNGLFPEEASPDINAAISVIGLYSFMNVHFACVNRDNLVLITNSTLPMASDGSSNSLGSAVNNKKRSGPESKKNIAARLLAEAKAKHSLLRSGSTNQQTVTNDWTMYVLNIPPIENVIDDLENIAESNRPASSTNFYDLMEESHVLLRLSLLLDLDDMNSGREQYLRQRFLENCRKLADFSIRSRKKEVYLQATGFYKMCDMQLNDIYINYINSIVDSNSMNSLDSSTSLDEKQLVGFVNTVKTFLLNFGRDRRKTLVLNNIVDAFFTPENFIQNGDGEVPLSLEFLYMFIKYSPNDITEVMLNSPFVSDTISSDLINYLKGLKTPSTDETLLLAVTACRQSNFPLSKEVTERLSRRDLAMALIKHKNVLFDDSTLLYQRNRNESLKISNVNKKGTSKQQQKDNKIISAHNQNNKGIVSFSDFTEVILLATDKSDLIEAISDAFIHALCIEHSITLDIILQLFLNYFAAHIGQKGYQTSQIVFVNILQVYFYDLFDITNMRNIKFESNSPPCVNDEAEEGFGSNVPSLCSEFDKENQPALENDYSTGSSTPGDNFNISKPNRIVYDELSDQQSLSKNNSEASFTNIDAEQNDPCKSEVDLKGLKILFRMYLGRLKSFSDVKSELTNFGQEANSSEMHDMRSEYVAFMLRYLQKLRLQYQHHHDHANGLYQPKSQCYYIEATNNFFTHNSPHNEDKALFVPFIPNYKLTGPEFERHLQNYIRPIPCLLERPQYLNRLAPFNRTDFSYPNREEGEYEVHFTKWHDELLTLVLKIQSLLAYQKICREIIEDFISFIHKAPNLLGIDSFLVIILPKNIAINFMLNFYPEYLWHYGKSHGFTPKLWQSLFQKLLNKRDEMDNWKVHVSEILNNLVADYSFEELLQCFPNEITQNRTNLTCNKDVNELLPNKDCKPMFASADDAPNGEEPPTEKEHITKVDINLERNHIPMDNIDENNVFDLALRKAVAKQRSIALRAMIESTGSQLLDATSNAMYNL